MSAGDLLLDTDGNVLLDGAGDILLKNATDTCKPCCEGCTTFYEITSCNGLVVYYVCCDGITPPAIGTLVYFGGHDALDAEGVSHHAEAACFTVTSACAALPMGGETVGAPDVVPDGEDCSTQFCNPCPSICINDVGTYFHYGIVTFNGLSTLSCALLDPPCLPGFSSGGGCAGISAVGGPYALDFVNPPSDVLPLGYRFEDGEDQVDLNDCAPAVCCSTCLASPPTSLFRDRHGSRIDLIVSRFDCLFFYVTVFAFIQQDGVITSSQFAGRVKVDIPVAGITTSISVTIPNQAGDGTFPGRYSATGGTANVQLICGPPTKNCYFTYEAVCTDSGYVVSLINTQCLPEPQTGTAHDWRQKGDHLIKIVQGGSCTLDGDCTPGDPPAAPVSPVCGPACYDVYDAVCAGGHWSVSYVRSDCSLPDLSQPWVFVPGSHLPTQRKIVKRSACTVGGDPCPVPSVEDYPAGPTDTADCATKCLYLWRAIYDCIGAVWTGPFLMRTYCGVDTPYDWALDTFSDIPPTADTLIAGDACPGGACSDVVTPPALPVIVPPCPHCYFLYYARHNCPGDGSWSVSLVGYGCSFTGIGSGCDDTLYASTTPWTLCPGNPDLVFMVIKGDLCNGPCTPPALPDPPETSSCVSYCRFEYEATYFCAAERGWSGPTTTTLVSATCSSASDAHDWALISCDGSLAVYRKVVIDFLGTCASDADCTPPGDYPDGPSSGPPFPACGCE